MSAQSEALRLADYCDGLADEIDHSHFTDDLRSSAAELRRLSAVEAERDEVEALRADAERSDARIGALILALSEIARAPQDQPYITLAAVRTLARQAIDAAIAKAEGA